MAISKERVEEILGYYLLHGEDSTCDSYGIKPRTLRRYIRESKQRFNIPDIDKSAALRRISEQYSPKELEPIA